MPFEFPSLSARVATVNYGSHSLVPSFASPMLCIDETLNICSKCLTVVPDLKSLGSHYAECSALSEYDPIYEEAGSAKIARLGSDGKKRRLSLLGLMFIRHKTVYFDVSEYDFFIIYNEEIMGYFSRPRGGNYSLCCLMVFPCFMRLGLGSLLIDFSYLRWSTQPEMERENESGYDKPAPERPFSKKAIFCFRKYWKYRVIGARSIREVAERYNLPVNDVILGLELNGFNLKEWRLEKPVTVEKPRLLRLSGIAPVYKGGVHKKNGG